jgi:hypothetical protein
MKGAIGKTRQFMTTPVGIVILFVLIFYVMTFAVYWFYSPGPEERKQAQTTAQEAVNIP